MLAGIAVTIDKTFFILFPFLCYCWHRLGIHPDDTDNTRAKYSPHYNKYVQGAATLWYSDSSVPLHASSFHCRVNCF